MRNVGHNRGSQRSADPRLAVGRVGASWGDARVLRPLRGRREIIGSETRGYRSRLRFATARRVARPRLLSGKPSAWPGSDREPNHRLQARPGFARLFGPAPSARPA
jgi:hypothetical protein